LTFTINLIFFFAHITFARVDSVLFEEKVVIL